MTTIATDQIMTVATVKRSCVDTVQIDSSEWISKGNVCSLLIYSEGRDAANIRNGTHCLYLGS
jgi:hypothetical protein